MLRKVRFGIVGVGQQGSKYAALLRETDGEEPYVLAALCVRQKERAAQLHSQYPDVPIYDNYKAMIDSGSCDAVIITVPHILHCEVAVYAMKRGVSVLCEKPAGVLAMEVSAMIACADRHPEAAFGLMYNQRTLPVYRKVKELICSGELGEIRRSNWILNSWWRPDSYYDTAPWRGTWGGEGGGILVNQAAHQMDLWIWLCGTPVSVYANCREGVHRNILVENDVTIVTEYENGAAGCFTACTHDPLGTDRLEISLSKGKIVVENAGRAVVYRFARPEEELNRTMDAASLKRLRMEKSPELYTAEEFCFTGDGDPYREMIANFADHMLCGAALIAPGREGLAPVELVNTALLSSAAGKMLPFPCGQGDFVRWMDRKIEHEEWLSDQWEASRSLAD